MLAAQHGAVLRMQFDGEDEKQAAAAISDLFAHKFNEEL